MPICQAGEYALLDKVEGKVLTKASTDAFTGFTENTALKDSFFTAPMRHEDAYIESDGSQGINLSYFTTPNTRYEIDYAMTAIVGQNRPFGEATGDLSAELYIQGTATGSGNVAFGVGNSWVGQPSGVASDLNRHVAVLDLANHECGYSGKGLYAFTSATVCSKTATYPMWLFAKGTSATGHGNRTKMKLYAFRIFEAGDLVHEYLPYKVGDLVGLYDTMTGDVITNTVSDANAFTLGGGLGYGKYYWVTRGSGKDKRTCVWELGRTYKVETDFAVTSEIVTNFVENAETGEVLETTITTNDICKASYKIDGLAITTEQSVYDLIDTGTSLYMFACNIQGVPNYKAKMRCYGMKIWQDDANGVRQLVRDFRPCMKNDRVGLYDAVSQTIFYSSTGTDLVYDANEEVPDEFVDYVEAHGNTYVDTEVIGRSGTSCEADMEWLVLNNGGDYAFLDARGTTNGDDRFMLIHSYNRRMNVGYGKFLNNVNGAREFSVGTRYKIASDLRAGSQTLVVNDETVYSDTLAASYDTGRNLYLFANNRAGAVENYGSARLYGLKIWQDGTLVRDFRPCRKHGVSALYDAVDERIFYAMQEPLTAAPFVPTVAGKPDYFTEYLQANGYNYLDTGVRGRAGTRAAGEFSRTQVRSLADEMYAYLEDAPAHARHERTYLGAVNGNDRFYLLHGTGAQVWSGYGTQRLYPERLVTNYVEIVTTNLDETVTTNLEEVVSTNRIVITAGQRYSFDVSYAAGSQTIDLDGERIFDETSEASIDTGYNIFLFAVDNKGNPLYEMPARCYGLKLWQDGTLVRDFKPCVKDGKGMLWDEVTQTLYRPFLDVPATFDNVGPITGVGDAKPVSYLEYVETDGTQYVDTEVVGRTGTKAEADMVWLALGSDYGLLDARGTYDGNDRILLIHSHLSYMSLGYGTWIQNNGHTYATDTRYAITSDFRVGSQTVVVNGATVYSGASSASYDTGHNLYLFGNNRAGSAENLSSVRLYGLKIWQDGELVRNFRPVLLDSGLAALWDKVSERVFVPNMPFSAVGPVTRKFNSGTVIIVR